ncbi:MAG: hypothetical protein Q4G43_02210, partial [Mobilicoccus sp.]|nr:hypothetical protein [Mobilicoccus sp.]
APVATRQGTEVARSAGRGSTIHSSMRRLAMAGVLTCALNGGAAFWVAQNDLGATTAQVSRLQEQMATVQRVVGSAPEETRSARAQPSLTPAHRDDLALGARAITAAATDAAAGPQAIAGDGGMYEHLAGAYARYVGAVEIARTAPADQAEQALAAMETSREGDVAPILAELDRRLAAHADDARGFTYLAYGALGVTTLASLLTLVGGSVWLARRTKRVVNPGLAGAVLLSGATSAQAFAHLADPTALSGTLTAPGLLLGGVTAAGLTWVGLSRRLKEYR